MRDEGDLRSFARTLGSAALGVSLGLGVLILGFVLSRIALPDANIVASSSTAPSASPARTVTLASATPAPTPPPPPTAAPTVAPTPRPSPTPDPLVAAPYQGEGLRLAAITIPAGYTFTSPIGGKIEIALYQFVAGEIRDASAASEPVYPYVFVRSADREVKLRPAAVDRDIELLVKDGDTVAVGAPLFRTKTAGASSWRTFYDPALTAQVVASAVDLTTNVLIDPVPVFRK